MVILFVPFQDWVTLVTTGLGGSPFNKPWSSATWKGSPKTWVLEDYTHWSAQIWATTDEFGYIDGADIQMIAVTKPGTTKKETHLPVTKGHFRMDDTYEEEKAASTVKSKWKKTSLPEFLCRHTGTCGSLTGQTTERSPGMILQATSKTSLTEPQILQIIPINDRKYMVNWGYFTPISACNREPILH